MVNRKDVEFKINTNIEEIFTKVDIDLADHLIHRLKWEIKSSIDLIVDTENENRLWICHWKCKPQLFPCIEKYSIQDKQLEFKYLIQVAIEYALKDCNPSSETPSQ